MKNTTPYTINIFWSDEEEAFIAYAAGLSASCVKGTTAHEAFEAAIKAIKSIMGGA